MKDYTRLSDLPATWQKRVKDLRAEACRYRHQRNVALSELAALRAEADRLRSALVDMAQLDADLQGCVK